MSDIPIPPGEKASESGGQVSAADLESGIERLEAGLSNVDTRRQETKPAGKGATRWWTLVEKLLIPILILVLGWWIKDSVDQALEREKLDLAFATEMQALLVKLADPAQPLAEKQAAALTLSAFGQPAVAPLVILLQDPTSLQALAAKDGLRAVAFGHPEEVCAVLRRVLDPGRRQPWLLYLHVVEILGEEGCVVALPELEGLGELLAGDPEEAVTNLADRTRGSPPNRDAVSQLQEKTETALAVLRQGRK